MRCPSLPSARKRVALDICSVALSCSYHPRYRHDEKRRTVRLCVLCGLVIRDPPAVPWSIASYKVQSSPIDPFVLFPSPLIRITNITAHQRVKLRPQAHNAFANSSTVADTAIAPCRRPEGFFLSASHRRRCISLTRPPKRKFLGPSTDSLGSSRSYLLPLSANRLVATQAA